jgi:drug/metabolite transporter (DMT)-like permease
MAVKNLELALSTRLLSNMPKLYGARTSNWKVIPAFKKPDSAAVGMLFLIGLAFALTFVFNRLAMTHGVPSVPYVLWQASGGALILLIACGITRNFPRFSAKYVKIYFVTGLFNVCLPILVLSFVAPKVPSGILSLGLMLIPLMIYGLALAFHMDRFLGVRLFGILLGLAGVLFVLLPEASLPSPDMVGWVLLGLVAPLCYALGAILMAWFDAPANKSIALACGLLIASSVVMAVVMLFSGVWWFFDGHFTVAHWAVMGAMVNQAIIFVLMFEIIKRAGPVFFSTSNYIATLLGIGVGIVFFGDSYSLWIWSAVVLMFTGLFCVNLMPLATRSDPVSRNSRR